MTRCLAEGCELGVDFRLGFVAGHSLRQVTVARALFAATVSSSPMSHTGGLCNGIAFSNSARLRGDSFSETVFGK
jgi:hypothetical protein